MNLWNRYMALANPPQMTAVQRRSRLIFSSCLIVVGVVIWFLADSFQRSAG